MKKTTVMKKFNIATLTREIMDRGYPLTTDDRIDKSALADIYLDLTNELDNGLMTKSQVTAKFDSNQLVEALSYNKIEFPDGADRFKLASIYFVNQERIEERKQADPPTDEHADAENAVKKALEESAGDDKPAKKAKEKNMKATTQPKTTTKKKGANKKDTALSFSKADIMNMDKASIPKAERLEQLRDAMARLKFKAEDIDAWTSWPTMKIFASVIGVDSFGKKKDVVVKGLKKALKKGSKK